MSPGSRPHRSRRALAVWAVGGMLAGAVVALLLGLLGAAIGASTGSVGAAIAWRSVFALLGVVIVARAVFERSTGLRLTNPLLASTGVLLGSYLLDPFTWTGRTALTQLLAEPGAATVVGDGALWLAAAAVGVLWGTRTASRPEPLRSNPYGWTAQRGDGGSTSVEWVGIVAVVSALALALATTVLANTPVIGSQVRRAICEILTLGQGSCGGPATAADPHLPTTPCVISSQAASINRDVEVLFVQVEGGNTFEVARMSDGRYRVTELVDAGAGVQTGVGGGVTLEIDGTVYGQSASADASAVLGVGGGRVWYVADQGEANRLISNLRGNAIRDTVAGGPVERTLWNLGRGVVDTVTGHDSSMPVPDEIYAQGGLALDASAEATFIASSASGSVGDSTVLGVRTTPSDGRTTVYLQTTLSASAAAASGILADGADPGFEPGAVGVGGEGSVTLVNAVTFDSAGTVIEVSATGVGEAGPSGLVDRLFGGNGVTMADGDNQSVVYRATLPLKTDADRTVAYDYLRQVGVTQLSVGTLGVVNLQSTGQQVLQGPPAVAAYLAATRDHGVVTQQRFETDNGGIAVAGQEKAGVGFGGGIGYRTKDSQSTAASYWDGSTWRPWTACG